MLQATALTKSFTDATGTTVRAVRDVSLTLEPGRIMALVGASGSGKSTLLSLLAGLTDADAGEVRLDGGRVPGPSQVLVPGNPHIRLVHQEYQLMPNVSVRANIAYALRQFEKGYRDFRVDELLERCRLTAVQHRLPRQVSGGEKQRTAIARAVAEQSLDGRPTVLLLDEPFSHLDLPNRLIVRDLLFDLVRQDQFSCLFVTHDATDALSIADTLGILREGRLVQLGPPVDVYRRPATAYVARLTGPVNLIRAKHLPTLGLPETDGASTGPPVRPGASTPGASTPGALVCLRPEQIHLDDTGVSGESTPGIVRAVFFRGSQFEIDVELSRYVRLTALTSRDDLRVGQRVGIRVAAASIWWLNE